MFYIFLPPLFAIYTLRMTCQKGRFVISVFRQAYNIKSNIFYNNLNKYRAFTLMCVVSLGRYYFN